jgi:hypothetical protein
MWNRQIRKIDLNKINFATITEQIINDDITKTNAVKEVTPVQKKK